MAKKRDIDKRKEIVAKLDEILQHELAGTVRYTHYSFMVFGHGRIPSSAGSAPRPTRRCSTPPRPAR